MLGKLVPKDLTSNAAELQSDYTEGEI
jgi:hypothetical protein